LFCEQQKRNSKFSHHLQENLNFIGPIDEIAEGGQVVNKETFMNVYKNFMFMNKLTRIIKWMTNRRWAVIKFSRL